MSSHGRAVRVAGQIRRSLSALLQKQISDPRLELVSITDVDVSPDLRQAKIYFVSSHPEHELEDIKAGFQSARGYIKRVIGPELGLRYMPDFIFLQDESFDYARRIDALLAKVGEGNAENR